MTPWEKLQAGIAYVNNQGIDVDYMGTAESVRDETGVDTPYNGCAYVEMDLIDLYADNPKRVASQLLAVLIHEFGHIMDYRLNGGGDGERKAWDMGVKHFPKHLVPDCLSRIREKCLKGYVKEGIV